MPNQDFYDHKVDRMRREISERNLRVAELEAAILRIRGWREIGRADTPSEKLTAIEKICDEVLD